MSKEKAFEKSEKKYKSKSDKREKKDGKKEKSKYSEKKYEKKDKGSPKKRKFDEMEKNSETPKKSNDYLKKRKQNNAANVIVVSEEECKEKTPISEFDFHQDTKRDLEAEGYTDLFAVQSKTFEHIITGKDALVKARTGSGKTLAFAIPSVEKLRRSPPPKPMYGRYPRIIVLVPTRELAMQVAKVYEGVAKGFSVCLLYGGSPYEPQENLLKRGCDIVVATPGRAIDHLERKNLNLSGIQFAILDEADEMLNFGFQDAIETVLSTVTQPHQTLLFSATIPEWVNEISSKYFVNEYVTVDFIGTKLSQTSTSLRHLAIFCDPKVRLATLADIIRVYAGEKGKTLVFANTKAEANEIAIGSSISKEAEVLHGDIVQKQREITMKGFRTGKFKTLIATDVAARGLDIDDVELVIQLQVPRDHETFIHRSGRTARAGKSGTCITFFTPGHWGEKDLRFVESKTGIKFERIGTPQAEEMIDFSVEKAFQSIDGVSEEMIPFFEDYAKQLIEKHGDIKAVASCLALISGHSQPQKPRSLLSSLEGYTTVLALSSKPIFSPKFICDVLGNVFDDAEVGKVKDITLCDTGAVFDMPSDLATKLIEMEGVHHSISFDVCKKLPNLKEKNLDKYRRNSFGGNSNNGGGGYNKFGRQNDGGRSFRSGDRNNNGGYRGNNNRNNSRY